VAAFRVMTIRRGEISAERKAWRVIMCMQSEKTRTGESGAVVRQSQIRSSRRGA
jgi:hypothetical protein